MGTLVVPSVLICFCKGPSEHPRTGVFVNSWKHLCRADSEQWDCWVNSHVLLKFSDNLSNYLLEKCTLPAKCIREPLSLSMPVSVLDSIRLSKFPLCCMGKGKSHCFDLYVFKWVWTSFHVSNEHFYFFFAIKNLSSLSFTHGSINT